MKYVKTFLAKLESEQFLFNKFGDIVSDFILEMFPYLKERKRRGEVTFINKKKHEVIIIYLVGKNVRILNLDLDRQPVVDYIKYEITRHGVDIKELKSEEHILFCGINDEDDFIILRSKDMDDIKLSKEGLESYLDSKKFGL